jgi:hypothetical protein
MKNTITAALIFSVGLAACSKSAPHLGETTKTVQAPGVDITQHDSRSILPSGGLAGEETTTVKIEAIVKSIDLSSRQIALQLTGSTKIETYKVSDEVRNLKQVRVGDKVKVSYRQALAFEVREPTAEEIKLSGSAVQGAGRAPLGGMPGAAILNVGLKVVTIESIDKAKQQITVQGMDGKLATIQSKYPENLDHIKKGQKAVISYAESVVAGVERIK